MKLAIFERSTSETRPHVIAILLGEGNWREYSVHRAQEIMEMIGMNIDSENNPVVIPFGEGESVQVSAEYAAQLVNDLQIALQAWANYVNG